MACTSGDAPIGNTETAIEDETLALLQGLVLSPLERMDVIQNQDSENPNIKKLFNDHWPSTAGVMKGLGIPYKQTLDRLNHFHDIRLCLDDFKGWWIKLQHKRRQQTERQMRLVQLWNFSKLDPMLTEDHGRVFGHPLTDPTQLSDLESMAHHLAKLTQHFNENHGSLWPGEKLEMKQIRIRAWGILKILGEENVVLDQKTEDVRKKRKARKVAKQSAKRKTQRKPKHIRDREKAETSRMAV